MKHFSKAVAISSCPLLWTQSLCHSNVYLGSAVSARIHYENRSLICQTCKNMGRTCSVPDEKFKRQHQYNFAIQECGSLIDILIRNQLPTLCWWANFDEVVNKCQQSLLYFQKSNIFEITLKIRLILRTFELELSKNSLLDKNYLVVIGKCAASNKEFLKVLSHLSNWSITKLRWHILIKLKYSTPRPNIKSWNTLWLGKTQGSES